MEKETQSFLVVIGLVLGLLWITKPKANKDSSDSNKYLNPKVMSKAEASAKENASIGLKAMREAIKSGEPAKELDKLKSIILQDYGLRTLISKTTGLLKITDKSGSVILEEK